MRVGGGEHLDAWREHFASDLHLDPHVGFSPEQIGQITVRAERDVAATESDVEQTIADRDRGAVGRRMSVGQKHR